MLLNCRGNLILAEYQSSRYTYLSLTKMNSQNLCCLDLSFLFLWSEHVMYQMITCFFWKLQFNRKGYEIRTRWCSKLKKLRNVHAESDGDSKNKLYLKLSSKEHYSLYSKGKKILSIRIIVYVYVRGVPFWGSFEIAIWNYLLVECLITLRIPFSL